MKEENETIIKVLNMYGKVPEQWELLKEIERLKDDNKYLNKVNIELSSEIERLEKENERYWIAINEMAINISKAIEYIEAHQLNF